MRNAILPLGLLLFLFIFSCKNNSNKNTLFTLLKSSETNITFNNIIKDEIDRNYFLYDNFYGGGGVGVGDFNNDGLQDIYFAGNIVSDKLYLNKGNLKFEDITESAGLIDDGGWSSGVAIADVNGDGFPDIFISRELYDDKPKLRINQLYINNHDLTFTNKIEEYGLIDTVRTRHATFLDFDKDNDLDLFVLNQPPNPGNYSPFYRMVSDGNLIIDKYKPVLYRNDNGHFVNISEESGVIVPGYCNAAISADFNNDGWVDLYVANDFEVPDFLYINNHDGTFTDKALEELKHISYFSMGVDAADINNDGWLDIMALDMAFEGNYRSKANIGGMNSDKFWNFVNKGWHYQYMYSTLQVNNQNNTYSEIAHLAGISTTDWSWSNLIADLDNDGEKDIYITNGILRDIRNHDGELSLKRYINGQIVKQHSENPNLDDVSIWDIIDFKKALSYYPSNKLSNYVFKNTGNLEFSNVSSRWGLNQPSFSNGSCFADLDNDGDLELVVNNVNDEAFIYENNSNSLSENKYLRIELIKNGKPGSFFGSRAKLEIDGNIQYQELSNTRGMYSSSESLFHFGIGSGNKPISITVTWPDSKVTSLKNVKPNQVLRLNYEDAKIIRSKTLIEGTTFFEDISDKVGIKYKHQENIFDDYKREAFLPHKMSSFGPTLAIGDVNQDGLDDFYIGGSAGLTGQLFIQSPNGKFSPSQSMPWFQDRLSEDLGANFFDADNDGDMDLYVVSGSNEFGENSGHYQDRIYVNDGKGFLSKSHDALPDFISSGSRMIPSDFDNDGDLDLFVGGRQKPGSYPEPVSSYILENKTINKDHPIFENVSLDIAPGLVDLGMVTDACWSDYDNDGDEDLIIVGIWMPIEIFKNNSGRFEKVNNKILKEKSGWWYSIEKGDFDNDGDEDFVVGNLGLNYKYKASNEKPFSINFADFDNNGINDFVLSYIEDNKRYPIHDRQSMLQQIPSLVRKFEDYSSYAFATLEDVYGQINISNSKQYDVTTFASYYVENRGKGKFSFSMLPVQSQLSPINDMVVYDFNADGNLDVLTGGNLHVTEISTPRNDSGIGALLLGDGKGNFESIHNSKSGIFLSNDLKNIGIAKTVNGKLIIAANNSEIIQIFKLKE